MTNERIKELINEKRMEFKLVKELKKEKLQIKKERLMQSIENKRKLVRRFKVAVCSDEIGIPMEMMRSISCIAESSYDTEVPYLLKLSNNIVEEVIPLTHPDILKDRSPNHVELYLQKLDLDGDYILCHTHPDGTTDLSDEDKNLAKPFLGLGVHAIYPVNGNVNSGQIQYLDNTTIAWQTKYFKHILKIYSNIIKRMIILYNISSSGIYVR